MHQLPTMFDRFDALDAFNQHKHPGKALLAKIVAALHNDGCSNAAIRELLGIKQDYLVSHLKRAGRLLTDSQLNLWHNNPQRITLGHVRAICSLAPEQREVILRKLLTIKISVNALERLAAKQDSNSAELQRYAQTMSEVTGRIIELSYQPSSKTGKITLSWHGLDDLDDIAKLFGFDAASHL